MFDLLMKGFIDLIPLFLVELHVDAFQVLIHLIFKVSETEEDLAIGLAHSISFML